MATAELKGKVSLNSKPFDRTVRRIRRNAAAFGRTIGAPVAQATQRLAAVGLVAGTIAVVGIAKAIKFAADLGDKFDKMSKRTGISTESLSELGFAATLSGTNIDTLEKGVKTMQKTILNAEKGLSTATDAFDLLGIKLEDVKGKTPEEQLNIFLEALAKIPDASTRAALAQEVLGKAGTALLPLLLEGADGLKKMREQANRLGVVITEEQAANAAAFNDALFELGQGLKGLILSAVGFGDMEEFIRRSTDAIVRFRKSAAFQGVIRRFADTVTSIVTGAEKTIRSWRNMTDESRATVVNMIKIFGGLLVFWKLGFVGPFIGLLGILVTTIARNLVLITTNFALFSTNMKVLASNVGVALKAMLKVFAVVFIAIAAFIAGLAIGTLLDRAFDFSGLLVKINLGTALLKEGIKAGLTKSGDELRKELDRLQTIFDDGIKSLAASREAEKLATPMEVFTESISSAKRDVTVLLKDLTNPIKKISDAFKEFLTGFKEGDIPDLPELPDNKDAEDNINNIVDGLKLIAQLTAPIRGFFVRQEAAERRQGRARFIGGAPAEELIQGGQKALRLRERQEREGRPALLRMFRERAKAVDPQLRPFRPIGSQQPERLEANILDAIFGAIKTQNDILTEFKDEDRVLGWS